VPEAQEPLVPRGAAGRIEPLPSRVREEPLPPPRHTHKLTSTPHATENGCYTIRFVARPPVTLNCAHGCDGAACSFLRVRVLQLPQHAHEHDAILPSFPRRREPRQASASETLKRAHVIRGHFVLSPAVLVEVSWVPAVHAKHGSAMTRE
jgi:hypothetical protein